MKEILASVQVGRDTKANWETINPILLEGEAAYEQDTDMFKIGDGIKHYRDLPYHNKIGPQGPQGEPGPTPQISMNVSTGNPGTNASVNVTGTAENPVINLTVPRGDTGKTGSTGPKGDTGSSGVYIGTSQPTDSNINVWIDSDGEPTEVIDDFSREAIGQLKDDLARIANTTIGVNLFNKDSLDNAYNAGIGADGSIIYESGWNTNISHKIPISDASVPLRVTVSTNISIYCYSASDALLGSLANITSSNPATLIENTKYVRVVFYADQVASLMVYLSDTVLQYEPYKETTTIVADIDTDSTLTLGGKAADAKKVGKITSDLKEKIDYYSGFLQIKISDNLMNPEKLLSNKDIDINGNVVDTTSDKSVTELIAVDPSIQLRVTTGFNLNLCQYDEEENKIYFLYNLNSENPVTLEESTKYVRLSIWNNALPFMLYQSDTPKDYAEYKEPYSETVRRIVNIYNSDSEEEIFLKLYNAVKAENCDVYWEHGTYEFSTIFELMKTKYGFGSAFELPVGGGCRYYFNGSTLRAFAVSSDSNVIENQSLIGSNRKTGSYELYDAIFEATGTVYVVHDEASSSPVPYTRKYKNIRMHYITDSSKRSYGMCLGGGAGLKANVEFDGCTFITESDLSSYDGGYHGGTGSVDFYLTIKNCYFSKRFQSDALNDGDVGHMVFCGNSVPYASSIPTQPEWNIIAWGNEIRSKLTT